jgi:RNA polymerase sigma factor (sigma-70 family)
VRSHGAPVEDAADWTRLACRITQGEREAEDDLARALYPRIRSIASVRLHGSDAAQDVAQDTIVAVIEALRAGRVRVTDRLPAFVMGTARNQINNRLRRDVQRAETLGDPPDDPPGGFVSDEQNVVRLDEARRRALVREAIRALNETDRRILTLTLEQGMTPREIAPLVGLTSGVVCTRKSRAIQEVADAIRRRDMKSATRPHMVGVPRGAEQG